MDESLRRRTTPPHAPRGEPLRYARSTLLETLLRTEGDRFWARVGSLGTPLVEPADGDGSVIVTFLDRAESAEPATVLVASKLMDMFAPEDTRLAQIPGTDVRALSLVLPADWVCGYALARAPEPIPSAGSPEAPDYAAVRRLMSQARQDPLCRESILPKPEGRPLSCFAAPDAPDRPRFGSGEGHRRIRRIDSPALGGQRVGSLYVPRGVAAPERFAVFLDGEVWESRLPAVLDELTAAGRIPPLLAVFVESLGPERRMQDYTIDPAFQDHLIRELPSDLREGFPSLEAGGHVIAGQSLGGLCAVATALSAPSRYSAAISQSGSFWWPSGTVDQEGRNAVALRAREASGPFPRIILECGGEEWEMRGDTEALHDILRGHGADVALYLRSGGHDIAWWERTLPGALVEAFASASGDSIAASSTG